MIFDLEADLNAEDDEGLNWTLLRNCVDPRGIKPGAVLRAGRDGFWSWVRIEAVDDDGQVHFRQISNVGGQRDSAACLPSRNCPQHTRPHEVTPPPAGPPRGSASAKAMTCQKTCPGIRRRWRRFWVVQPPLPVLGFGQLS